MKTMTFEQLRKSLAEAHGDKNNRGWRKNTKPPTNKKKEWVKEGEDDSVIRELEKDINFCKDALDHPEGRSAMDAKANYGKDWKKRTKEDLKAAKDKLKKLDPNHYLLKEADGDDDDDDEEETVKIVTFKTTDKFLVDMLQNGAINGITISTEDDVQTFGPDSFDDVEVNDWSEDDVEDDDKDDGDDDDELEVDDED